MVVVTQPAGPMEVAGLRLAQSPATLVLESMIMTTGVAEVGAGGGSTAAVVAGVVFVRGCRRCAAAQPDAEPVPDLQVAAQRRTRAAPVITGVALPTVGRCL